MAVSVSFTIWSQVERVLRVVSIFTKYPIFCSFNRWRAFLLVCLLLLPFRRCKDKTNYWPDKAKNGWIRPRYDRKSLSKINSRFDLRTRLYRYAEITSWNQIYRRLLLYLGIWNIKECARKDLQITFAWSVW